MTGETPTRAADAAPDSGLLDSYRNSLRLQDMRIAALQATLEERILRVEGLEQSASWRLTGPLRLTRSLVVGRLPSGLRLVDVAHRIYDVARDQGAKGLRKRVVRRLPAWLGGPAPHQSGGGLDLWTIPVELSAQLRPSVLIVAELSVPQCAKYRVWQKQELLERLGWHCRVVDWHDTDIVCSALQLCTRVVFYRVPASDAVLELITQGRRLGLQPFWEVDDLIFDEPLYRRNSNLATLSPDLRREVLAGIRLYRQAMLACGRAIASTPVLAQAMRDAGIGDAVCIENALDQETLEVAGTLRDEGRPGTAPIIVYGSGTKTHDADFATAGAAIDRLMQAHPTLRLRIIGELKLPDAILRHASRIDMLAGTNYRAYLRLLSEADIAIAPLEATLFNDAKSNIKFQEAAILGLPCVSSPRAAFTSIMRHGQNGYLAESDIEWEQALDLLVRDPALRGRLGRQALTDVLDRYAPERIAETQVAGAFGRPEAHAQTHDHAQAYAGPGKLRVLIANVFIWPRSFGGATIVAEELALRLHARDDTEIAVFSSRDDDEDRANALLRYDWRGIPVFAVPLPEAVDRVAGFDNIAAERHFGDVLDAMRPDVVHAHSIQGFGATILRLCQERGIPYVITLHDAWWLCDRQFMVRGDGNYCFQTRIDLRVCQACVPDARHLQARSAILSQVLHAASYLLCPSETHRQLYLANGIAPDAIGVSRNGIRAPTRPRTPRARGAPPRFGFVGGNEAIKGFHLVRQAFEVFDWADWELVLVDNTLNLGFSSIDTSEWKTTGRITVIPAYAQDGMDAFFDGIDVLLFPSQWKESYGLTVREALARDVWVVATAPGGQADDIADGINGRLIPLDGRPHGLMSAIEEILLVPAMLDGYVNPRRQVLADYDSQARDLRAVLDRAAGQYRGRNSAPTAAQRSRVSST